MAFNSRGARRWRLKLTGTQFSSNPPSRETISIREEPKELPSSGFQNPQCYAAPIGSCSQEMSREHYISKTILKKFNTVDTSGIPWLKTDRKLAAENLFITNRLCRSNNNALSDVDKKFGEFFSYSERLHELRNLSLGVDGSIIERWLLKVLFGIESTGLLEATRIHESHRLHWLRCLFGIEKVRHGVGLFGDYNVKQQLAVELEFQIKILTREGELGGMLFRICGQPLHLFLYPKEELFPSGGGQSFMNRITKYELLSANSEICFDWCGSPA